MAKSTARRRARARARRAPSRAWARVASDRVPCAHTHCASARPLRRPCAAAVRRWLRPGPAQPPRPSARPVRLGPREVRVAAAATEGDAVAVLVGCTRVGERRCRVEAARRRAGCTLHPAVTAPGFPVPFLTRARAERPSLVSRHSLASLHRAGARGEGRGARDEERGTRGGCRPLMGPASLPAQFRVGQARWEGRTAGAQPQRGEAGAAAPRRRASECITSPITSRPQSCPFPNHVPSDPSPITSLPQSRPFLPQSRPFPNHVSSQVTSGLRITLKADAPAPHLPAPNRRERARPLRTRSAQGARPRGPGRMRHTGRGAYPGPSSRVARPPAPAQHPTRV